MNAGEIKNAAVINNATEQFRGLLETHFVAIARAAEESFVEDESQSEPKAKASFAVEWDALSLAPKVSVKIGWDALSLAPKVSVKIGWSVRFKDESESMVDPLQAKLDITEGAK